MDCSLPGSSGHGILRARLLVWVAGPSPGDLPDPGMEPVSLKSPALGGRLLITTATWEALESVQLSSVAQSGPTLCDPMNRSTPGLPVHHQPLEFTQTHVHRVDDAIQP